MSLQFGLFNLVPEENTFRKHFFKHFPNARSADDVELMIGGAMEKPASGAVVGSTIACVLAMQFANLKKSDR